MFIYLLTKTWSTQRSISLFQKISIIGISSIFFFFSYASTSNAHHDDNSLIKTVFHVYIDGEKIGTVSEKEIATESIEKIVNSAKQQYNVEFITIRESITFESEEIFQPDLSDETIEQLLKENITLLIDGVKAYLGDKMLGYFPNKAAVERVLGDIKETYLPETSSIHLDGKGEETTSLDEEVIITDISFTKPVSMEKSVITPNRLTSDTEVESRLQTKTKEKIVHKVKKGETLSTIARKYELSIDELIDLNPQIDNIDLIQIGDEILIRKEKAFADVVINQQERRKEVIPVSTIYKEDDSLYVGESKTIQNGKPGMKLVTYGVTKENNTIKKEEKLTEEIIKESEPKIVAKGTKRIPSRGTGIFIWPTQQGTLTSTYGMRNGALHKGIDITSDHPTIVASDNGVVIEASWSSDGYGNKIIIEHNNGYQTLYAHLASIQVSVGETVQKGKHIGIMGSTGHSTGRHLHFEINKNSQPMNPLPLLP